MIFSSPKKHVFNSIKKIGNERGDQEVVRSLNKTLTEHPELMEGAVYQLIRIVQTDKIENFTYVIEVMLNIAEVEPDLLTNSSDTIISILELPEDSLDISYVLKTLDILGIIALRHPERIQSFMKIFLRKLSNPNSQLRSASFYILDIVAKPHPEYFSNYTLDLIRSLHSTHDNERLYAARLIGDIAGISSDLIDKSYENVGEFAYEHLEMMIRQGSHNIVEKSKPEEELTKSESDDFDKIAAAMEESIKDIDFEESATELLKSLGMEHLIVKPAKKKPISKS